MLSTKISFFLYSLVLLFIGMFSYKFTKDREGYFLGGRRLGKFSTAISACASDMSGWLLLGLPGAVFLYGLNQIWIGIGLLLGSLACWLTVSWRLRCYTGVMQAVTLNEYISERFGRYKKALSLVAGLTALVFFTFYISSGLVAAGVLMEKLLEIDYHTSLLLGISVVLLYTFMGGFLAVSWTDTIQGVLMLGALVFLPIAGFYSIGSIDSVQASIQNASYLDAFNQVSFLGIVSLMSWGLGYFGQPHILLRFMGAKSETILPAAATVAFSWNVIALTGSVLIGIVGLSYVSKNGIEVSNPETIFFILTQSLSNPWFSGILFAAVLSAVLSTIDSQLLVSASVISDLFESFYKKGKVRTEFVLTIGRYSVILILLVAYLMAISPENTILSLVSYAWAGLGCSLGPVVLLSLIWKRMTAEGALAGILFGSSFVVIFGSNGKLMKALGLFDTYPALKSAFSDGFFGVYELLPGFILSAIMIVVVSLISKPPSKEVRDQFSLCFEEP